MSERDAVTALRRFGLGARPGEIKRIEGDPRGSLRQSIGKRELAVLERADLRPRTRPSPGDGRAAREEAD